MTSKKLLNECLDNDLVTSLQEGEVEVYSELVRRYQNIVFSMIMRHVMHYQLAEDLTQEVFVKAFRHIKKFKKNSQFSTWLIRIALNHTSTYYTSKHGRQKVRSVSIDDAFELELTDSPENDLYQKELLKNCREEFLKLKPKLQHVFSLCVFEEKNYEEVAEILGVPTGTVRSRLYHARETIKKGLTKKYGDKAYE